MSEVMQKLRAPLLPGAVALALSTAYLIALLAAEKQPLIMGLLAFAVVAVLAAHYLGWLNLVSRSFADREDVLGVYAILAACVVASFFGIGAYTSAVLSAYTAVPHLLVLLIGGMLAALIGSLLLLPVLRTRGHYAALVTIAFALLLKTFLEVNDVLGGPQGMQVKGMSILGWSFNDNFEIGKIEMSFYLNYFVVSMLLLTGTFVLVRRLERSWIGLNLDALRLDEIAASCFGLDIARWKITAFVLGNFVIGVAGALFGMVGGFVAPNNYNFADSLIMVSILLLGGIGNPWGLVVATFIVVVVPEKLQTIQEYRILLFALIVIMMLLFRPGGLLPRPVRRYFPGWRA